MLIFNQIRLHGLNHQPNQPAKSLHSGWNVLPVLFVLVLWKISLKRGKFQDKTPKAQIASRNFGVLLLWTVGKQEWRGGRDTVVAGDRENYFTARNRADAPAPLADGKLETWSHLCKMRNRHLPHMDANIKCVLFQCLPYLPMPCYAVHMCCSNQANFIASGWVDQKDPHSLFLLCCALPLSCSNLRKRQN